MKNLKLTLSWDGTPFSGYQRQPHAHTVQQCIEEAWTTLTHEVVSTIACSRLDAGVHAEEFILNLHSNTKLNNEKIIQSLNGILCHIHKAPIYVYRCEEVDNNFHARFHAKGKHYRYLFWNGVAQHTFTKRCYVVKQARVDFASVQTRCQDLIGHHDFGAFRASDCGAKTTHKNIWVCKLTQHEVFSECWVLDVEGSGFLKNMIRNIAGTVVDMASKRLPHSTFLDALAHKDRLRIGHCAPGHGLSLIKVFYEGSCPRT